MSKNTKSYDEELNSLRQEVEYYRQEIKHCRQEIEALRLANARLGEIVDGRRADDDWLEPVGIE